MTIKKGSKVTVNDKYLRAAENDGVVFVVRCDPWLVDGKKAVLLEGSSMAWLIDGLDEVVD